MLSIRRVYWMAADCMFPWIGSPLTPVNYPPVSFILVGAIARFTGGPLLAGRAVALASLLMIGYLIYKTVVALTGRRMAAVLGALVWIGYLTSDWAFTYVGYDDPQLLAHTFSFSAFCLYVQWRHEISLQRAWALALLACLGVFTKHLVAMAPIAIAADLLVENGRDFLRFVAAAAAVGLLMFSAVYLYGRGNFVANVLDIDRRTSSSWRLAGFVGLFFYNCLAGVFAPAAVLIYNKQERYRPVLYYFVVSFLVALYVQGGVGIWKNVWFDFIIAASCVSGLFAAATPEITLPNLRIVGAVVVLVGLAANEFVLARWSSGGLESPTLWTIRLWQCVMVLAGLALIARAHTTRRMIGVLLFGFVLLTGAIGPAKDLITRSTAEQLEQLDRDEKRYSADVAQLRAIPGPALFENLLLGFDAGKDFWYDPFNVTQMVVAGHIPEQLLLDRLRHRYFSVIELNHDLEKMVAKLPNGLAIAGRPAATASDWWTDNSVVALKKNYRLLGPPQSNGSFFYTPSPAPSD